MRRKSSRKSEKTDTFVILCGLGVMLRAKYDQVRYIDVTEYKNGQWTVSVMWQHFDGQEWAEIPWTEFELHSC